MSNLAVGIFEGTDELALRDRDLPPPFDPAQLPDFLRVDYQRQRRLGTRWGIAHPPRLEEEDG